MTNRFKGIALIVAGVALAAVVPFVREYRTALMPSLHWVFTWKAVGHLIASAALILWGWTELVDSRSG